MSERPKIRIKKKGESTPPEVPEKNIVEAEKQYSEAEDIGSNHEAPNAPTEEEVIHTEQPVVYDEFAKPIPWLKYSLIGVGSLLLVGALYFFVLPLFTENDSSRPDAEELTLNKVVPDEEKGFLIKEMLPSGSEKIEDILSRNMSLRDLLNSVNVPKSDVNALDNEGSKYSIRRLRAGDKYTLAHAHEDPSDVLMLMIEPKTEPYAFYKVDLSKSLTVEKMDKHVKTQENYIAAIVEGTLGQTFIDNNLNLKLISAIEDVLAWTIDLFDVGDGDRFKVLYEEEYVNGKAHKINKVKALYFEKDGKPYFAFNYDQGKGGFFNEFGQSLEKSFLATPIKYGGVITSGFGLRVHPITGHEKEHLGTDFAAPEGTPIQAVADGSVSIATFKNNNGYYVKLKHDKTYETQYLHMQKFAAGIKPGKRVRQGDIIGFVGSTGLSSGPHVCYRFWKNKAQVNPMNENAASSNRIAPSLISKYNNFIEPVKEKIKEITYF